MKGKIAFGAALIGVLVLLEVGFRAFGFRTKDTSGKSAMHILPNTMFSNDSVFGVRMNPGHYIVYQPHTQYSVTIETSGHRATSDNDSNSYSKHPAIVFLGGPSMFGHGVDDNETCPYFLQSVLPKYKVRNLASLKSGLADNYVELSHLTNLQSDDLVVYVYQSIHDNRGKMFNRKSFSIANSNLPLRQFQYLTLDSNLSVHFNDYSHVTFPFNNYSATINFLENNYNNYITRASVESHSIAERTILAMNDWCKRQNCNFVLVYWFNDKYTNQTLEFCRQHNIKAMLVKGDIRFKQTGGHQSLADSNKAFADSLINRFVSGRLIDTSQNQATR